MNFKSFIRRKPWVAIIAAVLATVLICGAVASFTDTDLAFFARDLNEDNLLYDTYSGLETEKDSSGITFKNRDGVITINGKIPEGDDATDCTFTFASLDLEPGTYTYTCFDNAMVNTYYSYIRYEGTDGATHIVYGDFKNSNVTMSGVTVDGYKTFTLTEATSVEFVICIKPGTNCFNLKAYPVLVTGEEAGDFYAESK